MQADGTRDWLSVRESWLREEDVPAVARLEPPVAGLQDSSVPH